MIPAAVTFTPASGKRASSSFISGVTLPHRRRSDPGCSTSVGLRMLPPITPGIDAVVEKSARLAWPVSWKRRSLSVNPTLPGPRVSTALPLPLWPAVITFSRALISVSSHPLLQSCSAMFRPPFNGCPLYGQRHSPCLMLSRCGATSHGNTASGRSSPFRSPSTRPAAVASACPATPAFPDRRSAFPCNAPCVGRLAKSSGMVILPARCSGCALLGGTMVKLCNVSCCFHPAAPRR